MRECDVPSRGARGSLASYRPILSHTALVDLSATANLQLLIASLVQSF